MKINVLLIFATLFSLMANAQMYPENVYSVSANIIELEKSGFKYYSMDVPNKQCRVYNMDHSLFKTFNLIVLEGYDLCDIQFVSEHLFNSDDLVELVYTVHKYNEILETGWWYYTYETRVVNENGSELLRVPGGGYTNVLDAGEHGRKFLVWVYDYAVYPAIIHTNVYSLPEASTGAKSLTEEPVLLGNPYPNPSSTILNIPIHLPPQYINSLLTVYDMQGNLVKKVPLSLNNNIFQIPSGTIQPGTYLLELSTPEGVSDTKKVVIFE